MRVEGRQGPPARHVELEIDMAVQPGERVVEALKGETPADPRRPVLIRVRRVRSGGGAARRVALTGAPPSGTSVGATRSSTTERSTTHLPTSVRLGRSYITSSSTSSRMARRPRAPVPRNSACSATASRASGVNSSSTLSSAKTRSYCFVSAFFGSIRICTSASLNSGATALTTGRRPMNSGMRPNLMRSSGSTWRRISPSSRSLRCTSARKPMPRLPMRPSISLSNPAKAPPQMKRMFVVSIWMNSWWGCLRPPCGGTEAVVPSRILRRACCTPSPETSRVIEGFSLLRAILSISSM